MPYLVPATINMPSPPYLTPAQIVPTMKSKVQQDAVYASLSTAHKAAIDRAVALAAKGHPREAMKGFVDDGRRIGFWKPSKMQINVHGNIGEQDFRQVLFFYSSG
ncbi:hypothetical protein VE03_05646 [Pseudogymnoascus sp. 23342-1-I1]|nr:hypothetical protein VE03_05646 [Pseudogymnoascus sp. 23342-1-I1]